MNELDMPALRWTNLRVSKAKHKWLESMYYTKYSVYSIFLCLCAYVLRSKNILGSDTQQPQNIVSSAEGRREGLWVETSVSDMSTTWLPLGPVPVSRKISAIWGFPYYILF